MEKESKLKEVPGKFNITLHRGELIRHEQAGGGGFGDPLTRNPQHVARDVWNRKISAEFAREKHGVVVDPESGKLDIEETKKLRDKLESTAETMVESSG